MGLYIDPETMSKEAWLEQNAERCDLGEARECMASKAGRLPVCLVNNYSFTAAGICFNQWEFEAFAEPDHRPKKWYLADVEKLKEVCPNVEAFIN